LLYEVESTTATQEHINTIIFQTIGQEYIHHLYEIPSIEPTIRYLHVAAGFPVEESWLKRSDRAITTLGPVRISFMDISMMAT
jgi:hypothetical protein